MAFGKYDYESNATEWKVLRVNETTVPLSFGCIIDQTANEALKVASHFIKSDSLFKVMKKEFAKNDVFDNLYKLAEEMDLEKLKECVISKKVIDEDNDDEDNDDDSDKDEVME